MNKKQKIMAEKKFESLIDFSVQSKKKHGFAKCWKGVSYCHWRVMTDIVWKLVNEYEMNHVHTEVTFKKKGRADIFAYTGDFAVIIEVLHSESEKKASKKKGYYPKGITIVNIPTKDFKIEEFKL